MKGVLILFLLLFLGGCAGVGVSTYTVEQERFDTEIDSQGNRGYLVGTPPEEPRKSRLGPTRRISVVEFEFKDKEKSELEIEPSKKVLPDQKREDLERSFAAYEVEIEEPVRPPHDYQYENYTVVENDTLQKISRKFYGTTRRWMFIYEENKDTLETPDEIYPGMVIRVPVLK